MRPTRGPAQARKRKPSNALGELGGEAGVLAGGQREQALFRFGWDRQALYERGELAPVEALAAADRLQLVVSVSHAVAAHHLLHRLGEHFPVRLEVRREARRVGL